MPTAPTTRRLSTARLYTLTQPGHSLWGVGEPNPFRADCLVAPSDMNATNGKICGGSIAFGGGVPLYKGKTRVGGLGVSGDTACADHEIAKRIRHLAQLDPEKGEFADDIVFTSADGASAVRAPALRQYVAQRQEARGRSERGRLLTGREKIFNLALGIVTSIGGFVEVGSISTSVQAGAEFGFSLLWAVAAATLFLAALAEMAGRVAAVSKRSMAAAVRERFGFHFQIIPLGAELIIDTLLLTAELGGVAIAVKMLTGIGFQWWVLPAGLVAWLVLWFGNFSVIEDGIGLLGMVTLSFVVAAWRLHPDAGPGRAWLRPVGSSS